MNLGERLSSVKANLGEPQELSAISGKGRHRSFSLKKSLGNTAAFLAMGVLLLCISLE